MNIETKQQGLILLCVVALMVLLKLLQDCSLLLSVPKIFKIIYFSIGFLSCLILNSDKWKWRIKK